MREIRSYGSVGVQGGNELHYPENPQRQHVPTVRHNIAKTSYRLLITN